jgi:alginate O-acetyltransferase complex protein AlgJ
VAQAVAEHLRRGGQWHGGELSYSTRVAGRETHKGDLLSYLPLEPYFAAMQPPAEELEQRITEQSGEGGDLFGDSSPQLALVGTSYSANAKWNFPGALRQALGSDLYNYAENGHGPLVPMLRLLAKGEQETAGLRLVLWEVPERYLMMPSDLSEFDPQWLAQLRAGSGDVDRVAMQGAADSVAAHNH